MFPNTWKPKTKDLNTQRIFWHHQMLIGQDHVLLNPKRSKIQTNNQCEWNY